MTPTLQLELRPPPFWTQRILWVAAGLALLYVQVGPGWGLLQADELWGDYAGLAGLGMGLLGMSALLRLATRPRTMPAVLATEAGLLMPISGESSRTRQVPYESISGIELMARGRVAVLLVATDAGSLVLPVASFRNPHGPQLLKAEVGRRLRSTPRGARQLGEMAAKSREMRKLGSRKTPLTRGLLTVLVGIFLFELYLADGAANPPLLRMGANAPALVAHGQWFRLLSANFLHGGSLHLLMNGLGLLALGTLLERLLGWPRFLLIYVAGAFFGALSSAWAAQGIVSVGASTAVFGLLGSLAYLSLRERQHLPLGVRQPRQTWLFVVGVNTALPLLIPQIDWVAHVGGGLGGVVATALLVPRLSKMPNVDSPSLILRLAATASAALCVAALAQALPRSAEQAELDWQIVVDDALTRRNANPELVNLAAWGRAIKANSSRQSLLQARTALQKTLQLPSDNAVNRNAELDTLATLHYRLGDFEAALDLERKVLGAGRDAPTSWQVARFAYARLRFEEAAQRTSALHQGPHSPAQDARLLWPYEKNSKQFSLVWSSAPAHGAEIWLLAIADNQLKGALVVGVSPGQKNAHLTVNPMAPMALPRGLWGAEKGELPAAHPAGVRLALAVVDTRACVSPCAPRTNSVRWVKVDPLTAQYP